MFTQCRHILKTVKNVMVAKFELAFTRYRFHKSIVKIYHFQNVPASCECSLNQHLAKYFDSLCLQAMVTKAKLQSCKLLYKTWNQVKD